MSRPGVISRIFRGLFAFGQKNNKFVGEDHLGNKYYEKDADTKNNRRGSRWVEAPGQENDPTFIPEVPTEWDSWLRKRRNNPPTQEELDRNYVMMVRTQQRAKELEAADKADSGSKTDASITESVTEDSFKSKFPEYEDFEIKPGHLKDRNRQDN